MKLSWLVSESAPSQTMPLQPQQQETPHPQTTQMPVQSGDGDATNAWSKPESAQEVSKTLQGIRTDHMKNMPIDQKVELVMQKSIAAEKAAYKALKASDDFGERLEQAFRRLSNMITNEPGKQTTTQPTQSIWAGDDNESIFGH